MNTVNESPQPQQPDNTPVQPTQQGNPVLVQTQQPVTNTDTAPAQQGASVLVQTQQPATDTSPVQQTQSTNGAAPVQQPQITKSDPSQWQVVIIDDEPDNVGVAKLILEFNRAVVSSADSGSTGLDLLRQGLPTFLLLDIQMPKMSGWDVLKVIRDDPAMKHLVVIALTAHAMVGDKERILAGGFDGYIAKPVSPMSFIEQIKEVLSRQTP